MMIIGITLTRFPLMVAHLKQTFTLLRKVWTFFVFSAFLNGFEHVDDLVSLGLR